MLQPGSTVRGRISAGRFLLLEQLSVCFLFAYRLPVVRPDLMRRVSYFLTRCARAFG